MAAFRIQLNELTSNEQDIQSAVNNVNKTSEVVYDALVGLLEEAILLGVDIGIQQMETLMGVNKFVGVGMDADVQTVVNTEATRWVSQHAGELITDINKTTRNAVRDTIQQWMTTGDDMTALRKQLQKVGFSRSRARMIAHTETTAAYAQGNVEAWQASGVVNQQEWRTANDEAVCPICAPLGGLAYGAQGADPASIIQQQQSAQRTSLGGSFSHPGGGGLANQFGGQTFQTPPAHPNCRCYMIPVVVEIPFVPLPSGFIPTAPTATGEVVRRMVSPTLDPNLPAFEEAVRIVEADIDDKPWQKYLSRSDVAVGTIEDYTATGYSYMNDELRDIKIALDADGNLEKVKPPKNAKRIKALHRTLSKANLPEDVVAFRHFGEFGQELQKLPIDAEFREKGFMSTSIANQSMDEFAKQYVRDRDNPIAMIRLPKGAKAGYVKNYSRFAAENELLVQANSKFRIVEKKVVEMADELGDLMPKDVIVLEYIQTDPLPFKALLKALGMYNKTELKQKTMQEELAKYPKSQYDKFLFRDDGIVLTKLPPGEHFTYSFPYYPETGLGI